MGPEYARTVPRILLLSCAKETANHVAAKTVKFVPISSKLAVTPRPKAYKTFVPMLPTEKQTKPNPATVTVAIPTWGASDGIPANNIRSEERRVGKECGSGGETDGGKERVGGGSGWRDDGRACV